MNDDFFDEQPPSKSQRKREAHALQALGENLVALREGQLDRIPLPADLHAAILEARRLHQRGARKRQMQYIGKLMRQLDDPAAVQAAYERVVHPGEAETRLLHRLERWRERLIEDGDAAIGDWLAEHPDTNRQHLRQLVRAARRERDQSATPKKTRELFRYLKTVIEAETGDSEENG